MDFDFFDGSLRSLLLHLQVLRPAGTSKCTIARWWNENCQHDFDFRAILASFFRSWLIFRKIFTPLRGCFRSVRIGPSLITRNDTRGSQKLSFHRIKIKNALLYFYKSPGKCAAIGSVYMKLYIEVKESASKNSPFVLYSQYYMYCINIKV